jgi:hypothetical protein
LGFASEPARLDERRRLLDDELAGAEQLVIVFRSGHFGAAVRTRHEEGRAGDGVHEVDAAGNDLAAVFVGGAADLGDRLIGDIVVGHGATSRRC